MALLSCSLGAFAAHTVYVSPDENILQQHRNIIDAPGYVGLKDFLELLHDLRRDVIAGVLLAENEHRLAAVVIHD